MRLRRSCDYEPRQRKAYTRREQYPGAGPEHEPASPATQSHSQSEGAPSVVLSPPTSHRQHSVSEVGALLSPAAPQQQQPATPLPTSPAVVSDACAPILDPSDYDSIHCFRYVLAPLIDRKDPELSVAAEFWKLAQNSPMVLHMVCALGAQQSCYHDRHGGGDTPEYRARKLRATEHYSASLRLLALATAEDAGGTTELDLILATLWLMITYEQRFGDGCGSGLSTHLKGAACVLQSRLHNLRAILEEERSQVCSSVSQVAGSSHPEANGSDWPISPFSSRMVAMISFKDGAAALHRYGGYFNELVGEAMAGVAEDYATSLTRGFEALYRHSIRASSESIGLEHPQELPEDLHSRPLFYLFINTGQLRFLLSRIVTIPADDVAAVETAQQSVGRLLNATTDRYVEFIDVAHTLRLDVTGPHRMFVINVRAIVAHYHAILLCYFRIVRGTAPLDGRQRTALARIMNIGHQSYTDEGDAAMSRLAWPFFVAAVESDDALHRTWIMDRYKTLSDEGENYRRAYDALQVAFSRQRYHERRVGLADLLWNNTQLSRFLI